MSFRIDLQSQPKKLEQGSTSFRTSWVFNGSYVSTHPNKQKHHYHHPKLWTGLSSSPFWDLGCKTNLWDTSGTICAQPRDFQRHLTDLSDDGPADRRPKLKQTAVLHAWPVFFFYNRCEFWTGNCGTVLGDSLLCRLLYLYIYIYRCQCAHSAFFAHCGKACKCQGLGQFNQ